MFVATYGSGDGQRRGRRREATYGGGDGRRRTAVATGGGVRRWRREAAARREATWAGVGVIGGIGDYYYY